MHLRRMYILLLFGAVLFICLLGIIGLWRCLHSLVLHLLCVVSLNESGILKSQTIVIKLPIFLFSSANVCFIYFGALIFGAYMFVTSW